MVINLHILQNKPHDDIIRKIAQDTGQSIKTIDKIISFQFKDAKDMIRIHNGVDIYGIGRILSSPSKMKRKLKNVEKLIEDKKSFLLSDIQPYCGSSVDDRREEYESEIKRLTTIADNLKSKLDKL